MYSWLVRNAALPLIARRAGNRAFRHLRVLERTQYESLDVIRARQLAAVRDLLAHAYRTVPHYRRVFDAADMLPEDVRTFADFAALPVVTKDIIRRSPGSLRSTAYAGVDVARKRTSGSTGVPLCVDCDRPSIQWKQACTMRSDQWSGYTLGQTVAKVWGNPEYLHQGLKGRIRNRLIDRAIHLDTLGVTPADLSDFLRRMRSRPRGLLFGHAHSLYLLACHAKSIGEGRVRPTGIVSTAMLLHSWQRKTIEGAFGVPVTDRYGCEEVSLIASQCERHDGLHLNADSVYAEVVPDRPDSAATGSGSLVVTDLTNYAMPIIRYKVGDVVVGTDRRCGCGRGLPMIERVEGREADYVLTPAGSLVSGISLTENFALHIDGTAQVQIVQERIDFLRLRVVPDGTFGDESRRQVAEMVRRTFGGTMNYDIELVEAIPQEASGKYRFCVSPVAQDYMRSLSA